MRSKRLDSNSDHEGAPHARYTADPSGLLVSALLSANGPENCARLLEDLCTVHEINAMTQRLEVARLLRDGVTYQDIEQRTGASAATISRVNRSLLYGADGYKRALSILDSSNTNTTQPLIKEG